MNDIKHSGHKLFDELSFIIERSKKQFAANVNSTLTLTYWHIGKKINAHLLQNKRAEYGKQIIPNVAAQLSWSHFLVLFSVKSKNARLFYAQKSIESSWEKRELKRQIERKVYERTEITKIQNPISIQNNQPEPFIFKDPYFLDTLDYRRVILKMIWNRQSLKNWKILFWNRASVFHCSKTGFSYPIN